MSLCYDCDNFKESHGENEWDASYGCYKHCRDFKQIFESELNECNDFKQLDED